MACVSPASGDVLSIVINNGATYTNSRVVYLILSAEATGGHMKISNQADLAGANWETYVTSKKWTLPNDDGLKTVYVKFRNAGLEESTIFSDSIILDSTPPQVASPVITINSNARYVTSASVTLTFNVVNETGLEMQIVNDDINDAIDDDWEDYSSTKTWVLSDVDGIKTVYVRFKDLVENLTNWYSAEVILNTETLQTPTITDPLDGDIISSRSINVTGIAERGSKITVDIT